MWQVILVPLGGLPLKSYQLSLELAAREKYTM